MDRGAWWATVHVVIESDTSYQLSMHTHTHTHTGCKAIFRTWSCLFLSPSIQSNKEAGMECLIPTLYMMKGWGTDTRHVSQQFNSVAVVSDSLRLHGLQHARAPCPLPAPRVYSNSFPLSQWCHPTISSSVIPFSSYLQSFPAYDFIAGIQIFKSLSRIISSFVNWTPNILKSME